MFRWYQKASICYVYLEDIAFREKVDDDTGPLLPNPRNADNTDFLLHTPIIEGTIGEGELAKAKWFSRGWTLQELMAPRWAVFYDQSWTCCGTKSNKQLAVSRITGIDHRVLAGRQLLKSVHVAERITWAAKRETTKIEDMAYSLFGIFDVNMPLLYGEGTKAFTCLQEEILKEHDDMSVFAWQSCSKCNQKPHKLSGEVTRGQSIFARKPAQFSNIQRQHTHLWTLSGEHSMVGRKGLKIELPVFRVAGATSAKLHVAVLEGAYEDDLRPVKAARNYSMGIVVLRLSEGHYIRYPSVPLVRILSQSIESTGSHTIYIRKDVSPLISFSTTPTNDRKIREIRVEWYNPEDH